MNQVQIVADSISPQGHRITTFICTFWRALLAEVNTHRMLTRNSASSRAIPFKKMVEKVQTDPFIPMKWMKEHTGMQGTEYFTEEDKIEYKGITYPTIDLLQMSWLASRDTAIQGAKYLAETAGVSKQIANRLLEPFLHHTALITGTEFENFFALRAHPAAEIHFADLAQKMLDAYNASEPKQLKAGEWHMPFGEKALPESLIPLAKEQKCTEMDLRLKIATARCNRISYGTFEGKDDYEADIKLHDRLGNSGHWSGFEHPQRAMTDLEYSMNYKVVYVPDWIKYQEENDKSQYRVESWAAEPNTAWVRELGWCGSSRGFIQYRKLFPNENLKDPRVKHYDVK